MEDITHLSRRLQDEKITLVQLHLRLLALLDLLVNVEDAGSVAGGDGQVSDAPHPVTHHL